MEPVTYYLIDSTQCDVAVLEAVRSKRTLSARTRLVVDGYSRKIVSVDAHISPLSQKTLERVRRRMGKRRHPNNRRSS